MKLRIDLSESSRALIACAAAAVIFVVSALMPLAFRGRVTASEAPLPINVRGRIFSRYWTETGDVKAEPLTEVPEELRLRCEAEVAALKSECITDKGSVTVDSEGCSYYTLTGEQGSMNICRAWLQSQGDWRNWLDMCFDADTGVIYYLYVSNKCLTNFSEYKGMFDPFPDVTGVAEKAEKDSGFELVRLDWSGDMAESGHAVFSCPDGALSLEIGCIYYESSLFDMKLCCDMA